MEQNVAVVQCSFVSLACLEEPSVFPHNAFIGMVFTTGWLTQKQQLPVKKPCCAA